MCNLCWFVLEFAEALLVVVKASLVMFVCVVEGLGYRSGKVVNFLRYAAFYGSQFLVKLFDKLLIEFFVKLVF